MNTTSRYITGIIGLALGTFLIIVSSKIFVGLIYGIAIFIISAFIIFNKKEDDIEQISEVKKK
ncbi:hypothetical protein JXA48_03435 [Candidatus Woesearchaeota archaeon]|nr:hypothetical protein [Candidatus Woesearchaeota archaeon]